VWAKIVANISSSSAIKTPNYNSKEYFYASNKKIERATKSIDKVFPFDLTSANNFNMELVPRKV